MPEEIKKVLEDQGKAFLDFRKANDERLEKLEKNQGHAELEEKVDRIIADYDSMKDSVAALQEAEATARIVGNRAPASPEEAKYAPAFLDFIRTGETNALRDFKPSAAMRIGSDPDGGYFVMPTMAKRIMEIAAIGNPMRELATVEPISSNQLTIPVDTEDMSIQWVGETSSSSDSTTPTVGQIKIDVHEGRVKPKITQQLLEDAAYDVEGWLIRKIGKAIRAGENTAFTTGNGAGKARGFLSYDTIADASWAWGKVGYIASGKAGDWADTNPADKLFDVTGALKEAYRPGASWMMPRALLTAIRKFKDGESRYIWQPGLQAGRPDSLLGYPVRENEDMPAKAANSLSLVFGDFREAYCIVDRLGIGIKRDPFTAEPYVLFIGRVRVGGGLQNYEAVKLMKFAAS